MRRRLEKFDVFLFFLIRVALNLCIREVLVQSSFAKQGCGSLDCVIQPFQLETFGSSLLLLKTCSHLLSYKNNI